MLQFTKMHGLGNDFIMIDGFHLAVDNPGALAARLCDRHFGIGADGLIVALPSDVADAKMAYFNSDGGAAEMCGNGVRCLGRFLWDEGLCKRENLRVETGAGVLGIELMIEDGRAVGATVDMGAPIFDAKQIPVAAAGNRVTVDIDGRAVDFFCASMGNPHAVTFDLYPEDDSFYRIGAMMEAHPLFPKKANVEFCRVRPDGGADVRVWERGDGETLACGTGACAVLAAGASLGLLAREAAIHLPGGALHIAWRADGHLMMTGPAAVAFRGEVEV